MVEILIMALIFSVLINIVQALSTEFSKGYNLGMKYAKDWDVRLEALERTTYEEDERVKSLEYTVEIWNKKLKTDWNIGEEDEHCGHGQCCK